MSGTLLIAATAGIAGACGVAAGAALLDRLLAAEALRAQRRGDVRGAAQWWWRLSSALGHAPTGRFWLGLREQLDRQIDQAGLQSRHSGAQVLGSALAGGVLAGCAVTVLSAPALGWLGVLVALSVGGLAARLQLASMRSRARQRIRQVKAQLPFALDLMALCVEAGAALPEALAAAGRADRGEALGGELLLVLGDIDLGRTPQESFAAMATRLAVEEVDGLSAALTEAGRLGTPIGRTLAVLAESARRSRYQMAEKIASEAPTRMVGPTMLVLMAIVLLILTPAVLGLLGFGGGNG